jgi:hypothetical protein
MANKIDVRISLPFVLTICMLANGGPIWGQPTAVIADAPTVQIRCTKVFLASETPLLPVRLLGPYLQTREDFRASKLVLAEEEASADVIVRLERSAERGTSVLVVNRRTGEHSVGRSTWTDYPRMIALDVIEQLRQVCPGSVVPTPEYRRVLTEEHRPVPALGKISDIAVCSRTSWMDSKDLTRAIGSDEELKRRSIHLAASCGPAGTKLEITHNLEQTVEWKWQLKSIDGTILISGRVIAFTGADAARRIVSNVVGEVGRAREDYSQAGAAVSAEVAPRQIPPRTVRVRLMPSDFSMFDTRIVLSVDNERIIARDSNGKQVFSFLTEELRDVRHRRDWDPMFPMGEPADLAAQWNYSGEHLFEPISIHGADLPVSHVPLFATYTAGLIGYFGLGIIASPLKTPVQILELVWEEDGRIKTVSLQVPRSESGPLLHILREEICTDPSAACDGKMRSAALRP